MGMEGFREVFALKSDEVRKAYRQHRKSAAIYAILTVALALGAMFVTYALTHDTEMFFVGELGTLAVGLFLLEAVATIGTGIATVRHFHKAEYYYDLLDTQYITRQPWDKMRIYN